MILLLIKICVATIVVVTLSLIAEYASPRISGTLSGYPTGTAIILFFFGLEHGVQFAADSALYNIVGLLAMQMFLYGYYKASEHFRLPVTVLIALFGYSATAIALYFLPLPRSVLVVAALLSIPLFGYLFKPIANHVITRKVALQYKVIAFRAVSAASIVVLVTSIAHLVGTTWAGLFSAFPSTLFPLLLIVHFTYGAKPAQTIIKHVPVGLVALVAYSLTVTVLYPLIGVYIGTVCGFIIATVYLLIYQLTKRWLDKRVM